MAGKDVGAINGIKAAPPDQGPDAPVRVVLVSTPRSGNNWLRHLLGSLYDVPSLAIHNPADLDWAALPRHCVLGVHWHPAPPFLDLLERYGFRLVTLTRHPLDVLISVLHFALHAPTARWLEGEGGDERSIYSAMPRSSAFLEYATGMRATALLSISREWSAVANCLWVRYEQLVAEPYSALRRLVDALGKSSRRPADEALAATTIPKLRSLTSCPYHFWQGKPGLWRSLLTAPEAHAIAEAQPASFSAFGYACDPDENLPGSQADANWISLVGTELAMEVQNLAGLKQQLETSRQLAQALQTKLATSQRAYGELQARFAATQQALQEATNQWEQGRVLLDRVKNIGPLALSVACTLQRLGLRYPRTARLVKRFVRGQPRSVSPAPPRGQPY